MSTKQRLNYWSKRIKAVSDDSFEDLAMELFQFQATHNILYSQYISLLDKKPSSITCIEDIPFMPISFFKHHAVRTGDWEAEAVFTSSGTSGSKVSKHYVRDLEDYLNNAQMCFEHFFNPVKEFRFLALLPSYLEQGNSSLVTMADHFIRLSKYDDSGFFMNSSDEFYRIMRCKDTAHIPTVVLGVSFAFMDMAEQFALPQNSNIIFMETGGMKGRRIEPTRSDLHNILQKAFSCDSIASEYGMTELFSQFYSKANGIFYCPPSGRVIVRQLNDPFIVEKPGKTGTLDIIDLANYSTISFISTEDLGCLFEDGSFEVLGRRDRADLRGCNLLLESIENPG